ncbi:MAG: DNA polymerase III subunit delta' [Candidatus Binatia bacterium]
MGFDEIIGHRRPLESLRLALSSGRLHHAYLFVGPEGIGKRLLATALAQAVHCGDGAGDFCGSCVNCTRIADGNHPDVRIIEPLAGKKEISIQQVREFERELNYRSFTGKRKIVIVDPATLMNLASQNALLKTLEEPPQDSLIILIASSAGGILPTVRSRCLRVSFAPLARSEVAQYLRTKQRMSGDNVEFVAAMSMGSIGTAVGLDKEAFAEKRRVWAGMVGALKMGDYQAAAVAAEALAGNRDDALKFLAWAQSWYRDLLVYGVTGDGSDLVNLDMRGQIEQQAAPAQIAQRIAAVTASSRAAAAIQRNLNRRIVLEKYLFGVVKGRS